MNSQDPQVASTSVTVPKACLVNHDCKKIFLLPPQPNFFLDIFAAASMPVSTALSKFSCDRVQPIDLIHGHDLFHDDTFEEVAASHFSDEPLYNQVHRW